MAKMQIKGRLKVVIELVVLLHFLFKTQSNKQSTNRRI